MDTAASIVLGTLIHLIASNPVAEVASVAAAAERSRGVSAECVDVAASVIHTAFINVAACTSISCPPCIARAAE
jgi:hypothetical protein